MQVPKPDRNLRVEDADNGLVQGNGLRENERAKLRSEDLGKRGAARA